MFFCFLYVNPSSNFNAFCNIAETLTFASSAASFSQPGSETFRKLIEKFKTPEAIYNAVEDDFISCIGSKSRDLERLCNKDLTKAEKIFDFCDTKGVGILTYDDERFPRLLRDIKTPPVLLYYRGVLPNFNSECLISVVGTRRLSDYGRRNAGSPVAPAAGLRGSRNQCACHCGYLRLHVRKTDGDLRWSGGILCGKKYRSLPQHVHVLLRNVPDPDAEGRDPGAEDPQYRHERLGR